MCCFTHIDFEGLLIWINRNLLRGPFLKIVKLWWWLSAIVVVVVVGGVGEGGGQGGHQDFFLPISPLRASLLL